MDEEAEHASPVDKFVATRDLVGEVMLKLGSSISMIRLSAVSLGFLEAKRNPGLLAKFAEVNQPAFIGFIVSLQQNEEKGRGSFRVVYHADSRVQETAVALRRTISRDMFFLENILCTSGGCVLTAGEKGEENPRKYYFSFPSDKPLVFTEVCSAMPKIPEELHTKNTYGQFGVMRNTGPTTLSFFVKDWGDYFFCSYAGASCCSKDKIYIHVCELLDGTWIRHVSPPLDIAECGLFHRNAYCVLHGDKLYMMYLVGSIDCFDLVSKTFSKINLPASVKSRVRSWFDYTVCHHRRAGLALVHYWAGNLETWVLKSASEGGSWVMRSRMNLLRYFNPKIPVPVVMAMMLREENQDGSDNFYTVQVRSASENARFVLLTLGFDVNMYKVDIKGRSVFQITKGLTDGNLGRAFALSEQWPPKK